MTPISSPRPSLLPPPIVWWVLWFALTNGVIILRVFLGYSANADAGLINAVAFLPLFFSVLIRFLLLPRIKTPAKAFPIFVAGLATAEACGILGLFLGGKNADTFVVLSLITLFAYLPLFILRPFTGTSSSPFRSS